MSRARSTHYVGTRAMARRLLGAGEGAELRVRGLQQCIGEGGWDDAALLAQHQVLGEETLGEEDGVLIVDGSDIPKRGTHSAGVAVQWCGALGKSANCQAGIFLGYASRKGYTLLDRRLCLRASWFTPTSQPPCHRLRRARSRSPRWSSCCAPCSRSRASILRRRWPASPPTSATIWPPTSASAPAL